MYVRVITDSMWWNATSLGGSGHFVNTAGQAAIHKMLTTINCQQTHLSYIKLKCDKYTRTHIQLKVMYVVERERERETWPCCHTKWQWSIVGGRKGERARESGLRATQAQSHDSQNSYADAIIAKALGLTYFSLFVFEFVGHDALARAPKIYSSSCVHCTLTA